jgi:nucleoid-associated protein YgaU
MADMNKKTPLVIFTGLAVAAAGTLGVMLTGNFPGVEAPQAISEPVVAPAQPAVQPEASAATQPEQPAPAAPATSTEQQVAVVPAQDPAPAPAPQPAPEQPSADPSIPAFDTVNVMPTGEAVIAGHAKPGSEVVIKFAGNEVGKATASADGSFAFVPDKPLPAGAGALSLEAMVDGKLLVSQDQIAIVVTPDKPALVAKVEPEAPTKVVQVPSTGVPPKEVQLSTVDYDQQGNIVFQGRVTPGGTVRFYVDNQAVGDAKADEAGNWLFQGSAPITAGTHMLRADEIDATGKVLSRAELPFLREEAEKVIAAAEAQQPAADPAAPAAEPVASAEPDQVQPKSAEPAATEAAAPAEVVVAAATPDKPSRIIIQPGNNLWRISREVYGKGKMFTVIWEANRDQIKNPNRIYPGQILTAPKS